MDKQKTRLTETEMERCRVMGSKYLTRNGDKEFVHMWGTRPEKCTYGCVAYYITGYSKARCLGVVDSDLFPSVNPGDCICVEEAQHDD